MWVALAWLMGGGTVTGSTFSTMQGGTVCAKCSGGLWWGSKVNASGHAG